MGQATRTSALTDEGWRDVERARGGDIDAFGRVYMQLRPKVRNTAYLLIGDEHEAEDTAQDAFLSALKSLPRLTAADSFEAWIMRIARNRAVDRRRNMRRCRPSELAHDDRDGRGATADPVMRRSGVSEPSAESVASLRASFAAMPGPLRQVLRDRYLKGRSYEEIARNARVSVAAVKTRLFRARRLLRAALVPHELGEGAPECHELREKACVSGSLR